MVKFCLIVMLKDSLTVTKKGNLCMENAVERQIAEDYAVSFGPQ